MQRASAHRRRFGFGRGLAIAGALFCAAILGQPGHADAAAHGGGFHGGGGHAGGFHGGGVHASGFHGGGFHGGYSGWHGGYGDWHGGYGDWHGGYGGFGLGVGLAPFSYGWGDYPYDGYYGYSEPYPAQTWYYCSYPAGYYPYVTQCSVGWQAVPAS